MDQKNYFLQLDGISKKFGKFTAVHPTNLKVERGSFLTIVGPSGCGKTTLLQMIAGFLTPNAGKILLNGEDVQAEPPYKRSIGMVFQKLALFPHLTAAENIAYPLKMRRFEPTKIPELVEEYLALVRLDGFGERRPHELSGGQQQRVAIARALSFSPDLLLLDEPLSALDKKLREDMQLEFRRIQQQLGVTTVNVTHDQREALVMSDQIVVMNDGHVQQDANPREIYRMPSNRFVASFVGLTSVFNAEIVEVNPDTFLVAAGENRLTARRGSLDLTPGDKVDYCVRAEQIHIVDEDAAAFDNILEATVAQAIFEGDRIVYEMHIPSLGGGVIHVVGHDREDLSELTEGSTTRIGWKSRDGMVFPRAEA